MLNLRFFVKTEIFLKTEISFKNWYFLYMLEGESLIHSSLPVCVCVCLGSWSCVLGVCVCVCVTVLCVCVFGWLAMCKGVCVCVCVYVCPCVSTMTSYGIINFKANNASRCVYTHAHFWKHTSSHTHTHTPASDTHTHTHTPAVRYGADHPPLPPPSPLGRPCRGCRRGVGGRGEGGGVQVKHPSTPPTPPPTPTPTHPPHNAVYFEAAEGSS